VIDIQDLTRTLPAHEPDLAVVLDRLARKRRARRTRIGLLTGGGALAVVLLAVAAITGPPPAAVPQAAPGQAGSAGPWFAGGPASGTCAAEPLSALLARAVSAGGSIVTATGRLTGTTRPPLHEMRLTSVHTLAGPAIPGGSTGWVPADRPDGNGIHAAWAPGGGLFAIVWPAGERGARVLWVVPRIGGEAVFPPGPCWETIGLGHQYQAGPLDRIPGAAPARDYQAIPLVTLTGMVPR
jgi:hypothetical protein